MDTFTFRIDPSLLQATRDMAAAQHTTITHLLIDGLVAELTRRGQAGRAGSGGISVNAPRSSTGGSGSTAVAQSFATASVVDTWPTIHIELDPDEHERVMREIQNAAEYRLLITRKSDSI